MTSTRIPPTEITGLYGAMREVRRPQDDRRGAGFGRRAAGTTRPS